MSIEFSEFYDLLAAAGIFIAALIAYNMLGEGKKKKV